MDVAKYVSDLQSTISKASVEILVTRVLIQKVGGSTSVL